MRSYGDTVTLDRRTDGVAVVTINNPPQNALTTPVFEELQAIAAELTGSPPGAIVLTGQPKMFALGGEISETYRTQFQGRTDIDEAELDEAVAEITDPAYVRQLGEKYLVTFDALAALPCMTIAAIEGIAFGGGLEITLTCDYRIASERARLGSPEVTLGGGTIGGGLFRMPQLVGPSQAKRMYLGGEPITAPEALRIGLIDEMVPTGTTLERALEFARPFVAHAGPAQRDLKRLLDLGGSLSRADAGAIELEAWCASYATDDARRRLRDFFVHGPAVAPRAADRSSDGTR